MLTIVFHSTGIGSIGCANVASVGLLRSHANSRKDGFSWYSGMPTEHWISWRTGSGVN